MNVAVFDAEISYKLLTKDDEEFVKKRFLFFHKLMRAAIEDNSRNIRINKFEWKVKSKTPSGFSYVLSYDPSKLPFNELSIKKDTGKGIYVNWLPEIFK